MRKIRFRGLHITTNEWYYGSFVDDLEAFICAHELPTDPELPLIPVKRSTVGQMLGVKDKEGVLIYEGDICRRYNYIYLVVWDNTDASFKNLCIGRKKDGRESYEPVASNKYYFIGDDSDIYTEVIGNLHQSEEILKQVEYSKDKWQYQEAQDKN